MQRICVRLAKSHAEQYEIEIASGALERLGEAARGALGARAQRILIISNPRVFSLYGENALKSLRAAGLNAKHWLMGDGERFKTLQTAARALQFSAEIGLERNDAVIALGGGVVGDTAGFVAATYLRGIAFLQLPTTLLAQVDASIGGKVAVNTSAGKNIIGAFHHPRFVLIDTDSLRTLPAREMTAGWCECIKHGAVGSRKLFDDTRRFLQHTRDQSFASLKEYDERLSKLIAEHCRFKAGIVRGDEREAVERADKKSRRILNFGHTIAHALEAATNYRRFRHGEAVGYGMIAAGEISVKLGSLDVAELQTLRETIALAGRLPSAADVDHDGIISRLKVDKKRVEGRLRWVLLERIGRARVVDGCEVTERTLRDALRAALRYDSVA
ncbi:MAG: 3-dehydroquinate synthase [Pyrinomonadaceae bacterium]|nr:3-dehydroquinate synthase [Pyrinomonadaceae bacterium]